MLMFKGCAELAPLISSCDTWKSVPHNLPGWHSRAVLVAGQGQKNVPLKGMNTESWHHPLSGEMAQQLRALAALTEDLDSVPSTT